MAIAATLFASLLLTAADAPTSAPDAPPPPPPVFAHVNDGPGEIHLTFEEKGKTRDIVIRHGKPGEKETILIDGKPAKNATLDIQQRRHVWASANNRARGRGSPEIFVFRGGDLENGDLENGEGPEGGDRVIIQRFWGEGAPGAKDRRVQEIRRFAFRSGGPDGPGFSPRGLDNDRFCKDSGTAITCTFPKRGTEGAPAEEGTKGEVPPAEPAPDAKP